MSAQPGVARARGTYPPSFSNGRLLLVVIAITEISVLMIGLGANGWPDLNWIGAATLYGQWLALFCVSGLCVLEGWTSRLPAAASWAGSWLIVVLLAAVFSHAAWLATAAGVEPRHQSAAQFVLKSTIAVGVVALALFRYLLIRGRWRSELLAQAEARVQALQARIRPHFLFNSLNTIASLVPADPRGAESAILDLADIFRGSMRRADQPISLAEELKLARQYLDMEQRRLGGRLEIDWRVHELPADASVLPLMLQPLLENAVTHGVQSRAQGGRVIVYGRSEGDQIVITIANPVAAPGASSGGHGMALANIRERLQLAFGARASLLTHEDNEQFYAVLSLPHVAHTDRR